MPQLRELTAVLQETTAVVRLQCKSRRDYLHRVKVHSAHIKAVTTTQRALVDALKPLFKEQISRLAAGVAKQERKSIEQLLEKDKDQDQAVRCKSAAGKLVNRLFNAKAATKELIDRALPILACGMVQAAAEQLRQLDVKPKRFTRKTIRTKSTAADLLESQDDLETLLDEAGEWLPAGVPIDQILTELPGSMKERIVKELRESFAQDYWQNISETTGGDAERILEFGVQEGWSVQEMAKALREKLGGDDYAGIRSRNIARTESGNSLNGARRGVLDQIQEDLGSKVAVDLQWLSVLSNTTRPAHAALDGVPADDEGLWDLNGVRVPWPAHPDLPPEDRCNCLCGIIPALGMDANEAGQLIEDYYSRQEEESE